MNILFLREYPLVDGTFTLLLRLARRARKDGHQVYVLFYSREVAADLLQMFQETATVLYRDELATRKAEGRLPEIDAIHGILGGDLLIEAYNELKPNYFPAARIVLGVYHTKAFITKTWIGPAPDTYIYREYFRKVPHRNILFMNEAVRRSHESYYHISFKDAPIVPLPVDVNEIYTERGRIDPNRIVSIGRLVAFKNYHVQVIEAIADWNQLHPERPLSYHIYGDGPMRADLIRLSEEKKLDFVHYHGNLPYERLREAVADAYICIAMGTTVVETSAMGVPSLLAVENGNDYNYGWFFSQEGYEVGEQLEGKAKYSYRQMLEAALGWDPDRYAQNAKDSWVRAQAFSMSSVIKGYYQFIENADRAFVFKVPKWKHVLLKVLRQPFMFSWLIKKEYFHK